MNAFFKISEINPNDCPLKEISRSMSKDGVDIKKLDSSLVKDIAAKAEGTGASREAKNSENTDNYTSEKSDSAESKETRDLTEEERNYLKEKLGWSDKQLDKCTIDEDGDIHYRTDREDLEGKTAENGVPYERKTIEYKGVKIEGVFPVFESTFDTTLSEDKYQSNSYAQECNKKLRDAVTSDPSLRAKFTSEQLEQIKNGETPSGYVWHHNEEPGKMQLVKRDDHDRTRGGAAHTGGNALWGYDSVSHEKKGESIV